MRVASVFLTRSRLLGDSLKRGFFARPQSETTITKRRHHRFRHSSLGAHPMHPWRDFQCRYRRLNLAMFAFNDRRNKRSQRARSAGTARSKYSIIELREEFRRASFQPGKTVFFQPIVGLEIPVLTTPKTSIALQYVPHSK
jgi:hypothetical protein